MNSEKDCIIKVSDATVRFNMASEKIDNLKEYFVKLVRRELMFQEFLALKNVSFENCSVLHLQYDTESGSFEKMN